MKPVAAAAGDRIIKRNLEIVVAKEPVESRPGFTSPTTITRYAVGLQTRRYGAGSLERLLVETCLIATLTIEALRADRHKVAVAFRAAGFRAGFRALCFGQPVQRFEAGRDHAIIRASG